MKLFGLCIAVYAVSHLGVLGESFAAEANPGDAPAKSVAIQYIDRSFENASPLWWEVDKAGTVRVHLVYDQERSAPNRANGHWLFRLEGERGSDVTLNVGPFANIWNGKLSKSRPEAAVSFISDDGRHWRAVKTEAAQPYHFTIQVHLNGPSLYVARLEPYRISDLDKFKSSIAPHPLVEITPIGRTVEGRELEIIRVGKPNAPHRILLRARAHPWEPGGNWVVEGIVRRLLQDDDQAQRYLDRYCLYIMPMANKDGVARGSTRFNSKGMDLNRNWEHPADPELAPENAALEKWLAAMLADGRGFDLAIDFHNDAGGMLLISNPGNGSKESQTYFARMELLETLLRRHTWFTEGSTKGAIGKQNSFGEGLLMRYGIPACIHELNANWIAGLNDYPSAKHWKEYGRQLAEVFWQYCESE